MSRMEAKYYIFAQKTSADANQANAEKEQVSSGEDVEHGPELGVSVGGHCSDAPSMSLFQEGTEEYNWWIGVPSAPVDSNASSRDNTAATPKSCDVFDATPQAPTSAGIKVFVYDVTPIAMAPFSRGTAGSPKPQENPVVLVSSREPSPNRDEDKVMLKDEKNGRSKKRATSANSAGPKYKKSRQIPRVKQLLYIENFDGKRMKYSKKQNMLDMRKHLSSKLFYHPMNKVSPADVNKAIVAT
ncbi:hypothetical protein ZWY2020_010219 [Hordeum vulgare]|nr:hypothetical protein ZWY2020_010219 [Hordeum vulgare]